MERVDENLDLDSMFEMEETEKAMVYQTYTETMHLCYNFGFEVHLTQLCFVKTDLHQVVVGKKDIMPHYTIRNQLCEAYRFKNL